MFFGTIHLFLFVLLAKEVFVFKIYDLPTKLNDDNQLDSSSCEQENSDQTNLNNFIDIATIWNSDELYEVCI